MVAFIDSAPQIRQIINIIQHSSPSDPTNEEQDNTSDEEPADGNTEEESENESSEEESDGSNELPDDSSENENDTEGEPDDGNDNDSDGNPDEDTDEEIDNTTDEEPALPDSSPGVTLAQLSEGEYYIGCYKADVLYLATDIISSGHLHTTPYAYIAESDSLSALILFMLSDKLLEMVAFMLKVLVDVVARCGR
jgi:cobalamin biosynthesis protein CobT